VRGLTHLHELARRLASLDPARDLPAALAEIERSARAAVPGSQCRIHLDTEAPGRPLEVAGQIVARFETRTPRHASQQQLLELFAEQARGFLRLSRNATAQVRLEEDMLRLVRSARLISARQGLDETLRSILGMALDVTGARYGIFRLVERDMLVTRALQGLARPLVEALEIKPTSITGWVAHHRQDLCIADLHESPWRELYYPLDRGLEMRSEIAVPLLGVGGRLEGVLNLESPEVGAFQEPDRVLLRAFAGQAVIALQQVRLLDALQEVAERLLSWPCPQVLARLAELAAYLLEASGVAIYQGEALRASWGEREGRAVHVPIGTQGAFWAFFPEREPSEEWETKVLACLAHHAGLALQGEAREAELHASQERQALAETFAALGDLSANLMHQLNNKLGIIPVRIQGIRARCDVGADAYLTRNLQEIERSAQGAMKVVRESLQLLETPAEGRFALAGVLEQALAEVAMDRVEVQRAGLQELPPVIGGQRSLVLIFTNLLENAVRAMGGQGFIRVVGSQRGSWIQVELEDSGPGIEPGLHERIFEFSFSSREERGLGFGLWWVRTFMVRLGGSINVRSDGRRGTSFRLRFPA